MKIHSMEGLKRDAPRTTCTVVCGATGTAHGMRGITVVSENTAVTCLYDAAADYYLWIMGGQFVREEDVKEFFDEGKPPAIPVSINISDELAKFDRYHADRLPVLATRVQLEGREAYETLVRLSEQWGVLYSGPEGYARILETINRGGGAVPLHVLGKKRDTAEAALLDVAEKFVAECARLKLN